VSVGHYENFPVASWLLPARLRRPVALLYRFAREADDFADEGNDAPEMRLKRLDGFRHQLERPETAFFEDLKGMIAENQLCVQLFRDLLDAFSQDVTKGRYANIAEVLGYCRRSANPIGRLLLQLFREDSPGNAKFSDSICTSLQLINFWQDVPIDYAKGRIYLPQDEMARFGVGEAHIAQRNCDSRFQALMKFQVERAEAMLLQGKPLTQELRGRISLEIRATIEGGLRILEKLRRSRYDMFRHRPVLKWFDWPLLLARAL